MLKIKQLFIKTSQTKKEGSGLGMALQRVVMRCGRECYNDIEYLTEELKKEGISEIEIKQVQLVLMSGSFLRYIKEFENGVTAVDINNIVQTTAVSGLSVETVRKIVEDLLFGLGITQRIRMVISTDENQSIRNMNLYIPPSECNEKLCEIEKTFLSNKEDSSAISEKSFDFLNYCVAAGVPMAARILGIMYAEGIYVSKNIKSAVEYLSYAVQTGDTEAMAFLGDCYYESGYYKAAYQLYTGFGTFAVDSGKREKIAHLCNIKVFNIKSLFLWIGVTCLIEMLLMFLPASPITGVHTALKVICTIFNIGTFITLICEWFRNPYADLRKYSMIYTLIVFIYMFVYIL